MSTPLLSRRDLDFLLFEWLEIRNVLAAPRFRGQSSEDVTDLLSVAEQMAIQLFAPHCKQNDRVEPSFDGTRVTVDADIGIALQAYAECGFIGATLDHDQSDFTLPWTIVQACNAWFLAANVGTTVYALLSAGVANLLVAHASPDDVARYVQPLIDGRFFGTMCISEPQAGSSVADITTRAEPQTDGTFRIFGNKMWIGGGDHDMGQNIIHLVLATAPGAPAGSKGLSLYIVPKYVLDPEGLPADRNDVSVAGLNHKMGQRGTVNAALSFGDGSHTPGGHPGAVGYMVGSPGQGMSIMFHMMNEARLNVGLCAAALGYTGYLRAVDYARTRQQGRPISGGAGTGPQIPIIEHPDVRRMLLAQKAYVEGSLALVLYCARLIDQRDIAESAAERARTVNLLELLTPIAKSWPAQWCQAANDLAIQVHGGYGYTRDYDVEQIYRDNRVNSIYEGTHGIQALDLLRRKILGADARGFRLLTDEVVGTCLRASLIGDEEAHLAKTLEAEWRRLESVTDRLRADDDRVATLGNATVYLEATGHLVVAWIWLDQLLALRGLDDDFAHGKRCTARFFFNRELPKVATMLDVLADRESTPAEMCDAWF